MQQRLSFAHRAGLGRALILAAVASFEIGAQTTTPADTRPTLAILRFAGGGTSSDYDALGRGVAELLATALASNPAIRVVERERIQAVIDEQKLSASDLADPSSAVQLGRALGANHFISGSIFIDPGNNVRLDVLAINVETSEIEFRQPRNGTAKKLFELIDRVGRDLNAGLRLPSMRSAPGLAEIKPSGADDQRRAALLLGRAIAAKEKGDTTAALAAARDALAAYPGLSSARDLIMSVEKTKPPP